jgi:hypothetical protein
VYGSRSPASSPVLRAAPVLRNPEAELFLRAAMIVAGRAAAGGASVEDIEAVVARGRAQVAALGEEAAFSPG